MSLGHHLGPDDDVVVPSFEGGEDLLVRPSAPHRVAVHPRDPGLRQLPLNVPLHALGPLTHSLKVLREADGAENGRATLRAAVMASKRVVGAVEDERYGAARAADRLAAGPAEQKRSVPPAVDQDDRLLSPGETIAQGLHQPPRENADLPRFPGLLAQIDDLDARQRAPADPRGQAETAGIFRAGSPPELP